MLHTLRAHSQPCLCVSQHPVLPMTVATCDWGGEIKVWHWQPTLNKEIINLKCSRLAMRWKTVLNRNVMCTFIFKTIAFIISWQKIRRTWQKCWKSANLLSTDSFGKHFFTLTILQSFHIIIRKTNSISVAMVSSHFKRFIRICPICSHPVILVVEMKTVEVTLYEIKGSFFTVKSSKSELLLWVLSKVVGGGKVV